jgi:hypothetical protein
MKTWPAIILEVAKRLPPKWQSVTAGGLIAVWGVLTMPALLDALRGLLGGADDLVGLAGAALLGWSGNISRKARAKGAK